MVSLAFAFGQTLWTRWVYCLRCTFSKIFITLETKMENWCRNCFSLLSDWFCVWADDEKANCIWQSEHTNIVMCVYVEANVVDRVAKSKLVKVYCIFLCFGLIRNVKIKGKIYVQNEMIWFTWILATVWRFIFDSFKWENN